MISNVFVNIETKLELTEIKPLFYIINTLFYLLITLGEGEKELSGRVKHCKI